MVNLCSIQFNTRQGVEGKLLCDEFRTVKPRFNGPLFNENLDITNGILCPSKRKIYKTKRKLDITNTRFNERIWPVLSDFVKPRFHQSKTPMVILFLG